MHALQALSTVISCLLLQSSLTKQLRYNEVKSTSKQTSAPEHTCAGVFRMGILHLILSSFQTSRGID